jgi:hypothetical protein
MLVYLFIYSFPVEAGLSFDQPGARVLADERDGHPVN